MAKEISRRSFLKGLGAVAGVAAVTGIAGCSTSSSSTGSSKYTPGTYSATEKGIASDITVTMTFDETSITDVQIDASGETPDLGGKAAETIAQQILDTQGIDVDTVSGATVSSTAILKAAADCITQAGGSATVTSAPTDETTSSDWLGEAPEIADSDITETYDTEIAVVGLGTGGWIATMTAAEEGAKVLVVEKGENATNIREDIGAIGSKLQKEGWKDFPEMEFTAMDALNEIVRYNSGYVDYDLVKVWANESAELVDWLQDLMESTGDWYFQWEGGIGDQSDPGRDKAFASGHSPHKVDSSNSDLTTSSTFTEFCENTGNVDFLYSTALVKLVTDDDGKVTGFIAQDQNDQHYIQVNASKGVIMATGGYATNTAMMQALQPETLQMKANIPIGSKGDGSGIKAMKWLGANMDCTHESMMFNRAAVLPTETAGYETTGKWFWFGEQPYLKVNLNGERFANESGPYEFMLHSMYMQPYHTYCDIFDANAKQYAEQFQEVGCCRLFDFDNGALSNRDFDSCWNSMFEGDDTLYSNGYIVKADTIEELAEGLNIPVDTFKATVDHYNELCAAGEDTDYGKEKHRLTPVDTAPFYGVRTCAWHLTTMDGIRINTDMQVIKEDGTAIEGLYATGDCTGGFFANNYPNLFTGLACGRTMTFARHAAKLLASK